MACDGEERGTAETFTMERVLRAIPPKGVVCGWCGQVRPALLDPESQLPPRRAISPMRVTGTKAPKELWGNMVAHLWKICLMELKAVEDVLVVDGVPILSGSFVCEKGSSRTQLCSLQNLSILQG